MRGQTVTRVVALALVSLLVALALGGCGASEAKERRDADTERIEALAERFDEIVAAKDTKAFCRALAPSAVVRLGGGRSDGRKECLAVWAPARNPLFKAEDPDLTVTEIVKYDPPSVTARLANGGRLVFLREQGAWQIDIAPAKGQTQR